MEHIYTIPINEHFSETDTCPICSIFGMLENNELQTLTGAAMMEPDVRVKTNALGFCSRHFGRVVNVGKRLTVALIFQSHLEKVRKDIFKKPGPAQAKYISVLANECYICKRLDEQKKSVMSNIFWLWVNDSKFREKVAAQTKYCLPHYQLLLENGVKLLNKKAFAEFSSIICKTEEQYFDSLQEDIDWFCKKFDYRFAKEDWKNSKDSIERTVWSFTGELPPSKSD